MLKRYCSKIQNTGKVLHAMDNENIQVALQIRGHHGSKRFGKLVQKMDRLENELKNTFPGKDVHVDIWVDAKRLANARRIYKPFRRRHITFIMTAIRNH